jgi:hypothetical protein
MAKNYDRKEVVLESLHNAVLLEQFGPIQWTRSEWMKSAKIERKNSKLYKGQNSEENNLKRWKRYLEIKLHT